MCTSTAVHTPGHCQRDSTTLQLETTFDHEVTYLAVGGEIDVANADELTGAGKNALLRPGVSTLVVDMAAVTFMSAAGLDALVSINNSARPHGQTVVVGQTSRCVSRLLELTDLASVFQPTGSTNNPTE